jgi:hypothetical protein
MRAEVLRSKSFDLWKRIFLPCFSIDMIDIFGYRPRPWGRVVAIPSVFDRSMPTPVTKLRVCIRTMRLL